MMSRPHRIFLITVLLLISSPSIVAQENTIRKKPEHLNQILNWLPIDTETLVVANGPFKLPLRRNNNRPFLELSRSFTFGLVSAVQEGLLAKELRGSKVLIAVEASRRFVSPKGLGMMPFDGCQILKFDETDHDVVHSAIESCIARAPKSIQVGDTKTAVFEEKWESDDWSLFVAQPQRGVLICSTNETFLEQVIERMNRENSDRSLPDSLPEWRHINLDASVWGIRHYRKDFAATDPSSPLGTQAAANVPDPRAIGFVFWFDESVVSEAKARYLTGAKDAVPIVTHGWHSPSDNLTPTIAELEPGFIEITASIGQDEVSVHMFLFVLLGYLGHGVYL